MSRKFHQQKIMQKEYGLCSLSNSQNIRYCRTCCNYQTSAVLPEKKVCIAHGDNGKTESIWDPSCVACGLYNRPFRGLRPRRRAILDVGQKAPVSGGQEDAQCENFSLF